MTHPVSFIPIDLRNRLAADADRAAARGDRPCAAILLQLAAYDGADPRHVRDLKAEGCTARYGSTLELMRLVVAAEEEAERRGRLKRSS